MTEAISRPDDAPPVQEGAATDAGAKNRRWAGLLGYRASFIVCFLAAWWLLHRFVLPDVLPSVGGTLGEMVDLLTGAEFYEQMVLTVRRVLGAPHVAPLDQRIHGAAQGGEGESAELIREAVQRQLLVGCGHGVHRLELRQREPGVLDRLDEAVAGRLGQEAKELAEAAGGVRSCLHSRKCCGRATVGV